jgi:uncharacterized protein Usg
LGGSESSEEEAMRDTREFELMMNGYGLTTAQILYHLPDHPHLLQTFIWQEYDLAPRFPVLFKFIEFWKAKLEGPLHSITYTHKRLIAPNEWRSVTGELVLH